MELYKSNKCKTGKIDSTAYGNYNNSTFTINNQLYAVHTKNNAWTFATSYSKGNTTVGSNGDSTRRVEIATGSSEATKTKNIYDLAGNMYEWTTETGNRNTSNTYAVLRGGSFNHYGSSSPVVYRSGNSTVGGADVGIGFRVVLYVNV